MKYHRHCSCGTTTITNGKISPECPTCALEQLRKDMRDLMRQVEIQHERGNAIAWGLYQRLCKKHPQINQLTQGNRREKTFEPLKTMPEKIHTELTADGGLRQPRHLRPLGYTGGSDYGRAVMDRNAAEELAQEAYTNGHMDLRDEMLAEYRAAKERVRILQHNVERIHGDHNGLNPTNAVPPVPLARLAPDTRISTTAIAAQFGTGPAQDCWVARDDGGDSVLVGYGHDDRATVPRSSIRLPNPEPTHV